MSARPFATMDWQPDEDGWLYRQQQWGEPSNFGHPYAFTVRGVIHAHGWALAAAVDAQCGRPVEMDQRRAA